MNKKQYIAPEIETIATCAQSSLLRWSKVQVGTKTGDNFIVEEEFPLEDEDNDEDFDDNEAY